MAFLPAHRLVTLVPFVAAGIWGLIELRRVSRGGLRHAAPFALCVAAALVLQYAPFTRIWLDANFRWHQAARAEVVRQVESGELLPNVAHNASLIALRRDRSSLSAGGNEILVDVRDGKPWVLFFTYRGVLNHYSGFLYVPDGGDPHDFHDLAERRHQVVSYGPHWYFVAR